MHSHNNLFFFFLLPIFLSGQQGLVVVLAHSHPHHLYSFRPTKLFVFGDSYSDTGNSRKSQANSWRFPYGITFPGKPSGRFSDGRVLTDFLAKFIGMKSPVSYQWRKIVDAKHLKSGMNFATGDTGVFDTSVAPNMTLQIDRFQRLVRERVYPASGLKSSVALVTLSGKDYAYYLAKNGTNEGLPAFINSVVNQLYVNLKRIRDLGVKKIALTSLEPIGCLPKNTRNSSFTQCSAPQNALVELHNALLQKAVAKLNNQTRDSPFLVLDLYTSFMAVLGNNVYHKGIMKFDKPLKPCCVGKSSEHSCGSVDAYGDYEFTVCPKPQSAFFWDDTHPTEQGWRVVYSSLQNTLYQLVS